MTNITTIQISKTTREKLEKYKEYRRETYDEAINKLIQVREMVEHEPELKLEIIEELDAAERQLKRGMGISTKELAKKLGVSI